MKINCANANEKLNHNFIYHLFKTEQEKRRSRRSILPTSRFCDATTHGRLFWLQGEE